jgi:hypothetical protein
MSGLELVDEEAEMSYSKIMAKKRQRSRSNTKKKAS